MDKYTKQSFIWGIVIIAVAYFALTGWIDSNNTVVEVEKIQSSESKTVEDK